MSLDNEEGFVEWHIIFSDTDLKHWFFLFLKPKFRHVCAVKKSRGGQFWCVINPRSTYIEIELETLEMYPTIRDYAGKDATIVACKVDLAALNIVHQPCLLTCVDVVKGVLGINKWFCLTPYQLFKHLRGTT